ncbi:MAG: choice-of-anchor D domain-containing protein [Pseudomonadota bacterium]
MSGVTRTARFPAALMLVAGLLTTSLATADSISYSGDLELDPDGVFANPLSSVCTSCPYDVQGFVVDTDGLYTIDAFYPGDTSIDENMDGYLILFEGNFDPLNPVNIVASDDDGPGGSNTSQILDVSLSSGQSYFLVTTAFDDAPTSFGQPTGPFENTISGPGGIVLTEDENVSFPYSGRFTACSQSCDGIDSLGGPGGADNGFASTLTGFLRAAAPPDSTFTDADVAAYSFEIMNAAVPFEEYDGTNATTANPFRLDPTTAILSAQGTTDSNGNFSDGVLNFTLTDADFAAVAAFVEIDLVSGTALGCESDGCVATSDPVFVVSGGFAANMEPLISVAPLLVDYGTITEGQTESLSVTVRNVGAGALAIGAIGNPEPPFSIATDTCSGQSLGAFETCSVFIDAMPEAPGLFIDTLVIPSSDTLNPEVVVNLLFVGVEAQPGEPNIAVSAPQKPLTTIVGNPVPASIRVSNTGDAPLAIGQIGETDPLGIPFYITADQCSGRTLGPSQSCNTYWIFAPTDAGTFPETVDVPSNDPDDPSVTVTFSAEALEGPDVVPLDVLPQTCPNDLDVNEALTERVVVAIMGTADLDVSTIDVTSIRVNGICPSRSRTEDIGTPFEPFAGRDDPDDCNDLGADGFDDLVLEFRRYRFLERFGNVSNGDVRDVKLRAEFKSQFGGGVMVGQDVVVIVDEPGARSK